MKKYKTTDKNEKLRNIVTNCNFIWSKWLFNELWRISVKEINNVFTYILDIILFEFKSS